MPQNERTERTERTERSAAGYRAPRAAKLAGITYRQLDYWARQNYVRPSVEDAKGSGSQREYSFKDVLKLKVMKHLLDQGLSLQKTRLAIDALERAGEDVASVRLVLAGSEALVVHSDGEVSNALTRQGVFAAVVLPMEGLVQELRTAISEQPAEGEPRKAASGG